MLAFAAPLQETELATLLLRKGNKPPFLVAVDGVTDPGNLGALLRCCDGAGVHGVVLPRHRAVHITPTVAKAAAGAVEHVPMALVGGLPAALARIKEAGIWVVGLDDEADRSLFDIGDLAIEGICLVLGAEGNGLSRLVRERCDMIVSIPMRGRLSSLNVSAAAALATYEVDPPPRPLSGRDTRLHPQPGGFRLGSRERSRPDADLGTITPRCRRRAGRHGGQGEVGGTVSVTVSVSVPTTMELGTTVLAGIESGGSVVSVPSRGQVTFTTFCDSKLKVDVARSP